MATNVLDVNQLSDDDILREYKAQQSTERGFRFLKDPLFFTSSVFLNSTERVAALAMVMGLCLLVYSLGQRSLRQALERAKQTIDNHLGKPTATPTLRWVFQCFMSIHLVTVAQTKQVANLTLGATLDSPVFWCPLSKILSPLLTNLRNVGYDARIAAPWTVPRHNTTRDAFSRSGARTRAGRYLSHL